MENSHHLKSKITLHSLGEELEEILANIVNKNGGIHTNLIDEIAEILNKKINKNDGTFFIGQYRKTQAIEKTIAKIIK